MSTFGEYCPIAAAVDCLGDRWTPLIIRELTVGSSGFNEIHRGLPRLSRTLLSSRLKDMERRGIISRHDAGKNVQYRLTPAGMELGPIVWDMGRWAAKWSFGDPEEDQLDYTWLVWRLHQQLMNDRIPDTRTVVQFLLAGNGGGTAWLVVQRGDSTACFIDPGYDVDLVVEGHNPDMHRWFVGAVTFKELQQTGRVRLIGPSKVARAFPTWFDNTRFSESFRAAKQRALSA